MFKIDNAIILAAGRGSRMGALTNETPKPLLKLADNRPMIEPIIENLMSKGINDISIVVGYLSEQFNYLRDKYPNIKIYKNNEWDKGNNITSLMCVVNVLSNTLIINGDVIIKKNCIASTYTSSCTYAEQNTNIDEWLVNLDQEGNISSFDKKPINQSGLYQREVTVISSELSQYIRQEIQNNHYDINEYYEFLVLNIARKYHISFKPHVVDKDSLCDIDSLSDV